MSQFLQTLCAFLLGGLLSLAIQFALELRRERGEQTTREAPAATETRMTARQRFGISYWDAAILEAARSLGCETVLSEDLSDGQDYGGVKVHNPFS